jgi:hypothetical protein
MNPMKHSLPADTPIGGQKAPGETGPEPAVATTSPGRSSALTEIAQQQGVQMIGLAVLMG